MSKIMLVDDEPNVIRALHRVISREGHAVCGFSDGTSALHYAEAETIDLVIADYKMPGMNGVELLKAMKRAQPDAMRIILSGYADLQALIGAINEAEIYRFISKPWHDYDLKAAIAHALSLRDLQLENRRLADTVRRQQATLHSLEKHYPGISHVDWADDGSILLEAPGPESKAGDR